MRNVVVWYAYVGGKPREELQGSFAFYLPEGRQPNRFHRWTQYIFLGIYWRRVVK
jgi:hypothetical protein